MRTIVVSGVNLRKGGTLAIMRQCLEYLAAKTDEYRIVALVHRKDLYTTKGIEYIELPWCTRSWFHRLWAEYVTMNRISKQIAAQDGRTVWLWLSMHDTTPRVEAEHQEVYCHTSFPFLKVRLRDWLMDPKVPLFASFTRLAYRINVNRNDCLIVQQNWFADSLSKMLGVPREKFRVIPPVSPSVVVQKANPVPYTFLFVSTPDCHKNFETLCEAARILEREGRKFKVMITVKGDENRYARWLKRKWGDVGSIDFHGFMTKDELYAAYASAGCFVFPSRIETWGLPISEFVAVQPEGNMILSDLPYAHETSAGSKGRVQYFNPDSAAELAEKMKEVLR